MKKITLTFLTSIMLLTISCQDGTNGNSTNSSINLHNQNDTLSWVVGESLAKGIMSSGLEFDQDLVLKAIKHTLADKAQPLDEDTYNAALNYLNTMIMTNQRQQIETQMTDAKAKEDAYFEKLLSENKSVKKAKEGFYYEVIRDGKGSKAKEREVVKFDFKAWFTNGQLYDQTYGNRDAITHVVGNPMFLGMQQALTYMNAGSLYRFYFPFANAFGVEGTDGIPPCTTVIYEIELHEILR